MKPTACATRFTILAVLHFIAILSVPGQSRNKTPSSNLILFGRGTYPGDDSTFEAISTAGFNTIILSSFYIRSNGDVYSGDDAKNPVIHDGQYIGDKDWLKRVRSLRKASGTIRRIEILLEGRWFNQAPNTYDFIRDWIDSAKGESNIVTGTGKGSTISQIASVFKEIIGADAVCIDDESVYDSISIIRLGKALQRAGLKMTLCPYTRLPFWKAVLDSSAKSVTDAVYLQCYDGGRRNTPAPWVKGLGSAMPLYPIFLCRGAFGTCASTHNSKTPAEITATMNQYRKEYPDLSGGGIWQMADIKNYILNNCAVQDPTSGTAASLTQYLEQLKRSLE